MSGTDLNLNQAAVLSFLCKAIARRGQKSIAEAEWDLSQDIWYNYCDVDLTPESLRVTIQELIHLGLVEDICREDETPAFTITESGSALNQTLTADREALAAMQWEKAPICKAVRASLYGDVMRILSGREEPEDVAFFDTLGVDFARLILAAYETANIPRKILDFGCGMSGITDVLKQRTDSHSNDYFLVDSSREATELLSRKHAEDPRTHIVCADHRNLAERLPDTDFNLILVLDMLYFIADKDETRAVLALALFDRLAVNGEMVITLNARPKFSSEEVAAIGPDLPIEHPRSGLSKIFMALMALSVKGVAEISVHTAPYWPFWERALAAFDGLDTQSVIAAERIKFQAKQALEQRASCPSSPVNAFALRVRKLSVDLASVEAAL